jgi:hypothetical protein
MPAVIRCSWRQASRRSFRVRPLRGSGCPSRTPGDFNSVTALGALVYREGNRWMRVSLPNASGGSPGAAPFLFSGPYLNVLGRSHDMAPDGRHLLIAGPSEVTTTLLTVVTNCVTR